MSVEQPNEPDKQTGGLLAFVQLRTCILFSAECVIQSLSP